MNRKQFIILLVLVAVLGAAGLVIHQRGQQSWRSAGQSIGQKLLPDFPVNDIAQITIKSGTNQLNLARRDNVWSVAERGNYPANFSQISELLLKFTDLKIAQVEEIGPSQLGRFELLPLGADANAGTLIEFKDAGGKVRNSVLLGKKHLRKPSGGSQFGGDEGWPDGRYVKADDANTVVLISDALDSVQPKPESWLNKDFFSIEKPRSIAVQFSEATNSWKLTRASETNDWQLADLKAGEKLDDAKISGVTSPFSSASFNDVLPGDTKPEAVGLTNVTTVVVETFDDFTYTLKLGQKHDVTFPLALTVTANLPASRVAAKDEKPEDKQRLDKEFADQHKKLADKLANEARLSKWVYLVPSYSVESLLKPHGDLLAEVKKDEKPAAAK
jgi:Domain of unknown function (DUF4340)